MHIPYYVGFTCLCMCVCTCTCVCKLISRPNIFTLKHSPPAQAGLADFDRVARLELLL